MDGSSKFKKGIFLDPQSSDPGNPAEGDVQYADGTARTEGLWSYQGAAWEKVGDPTTTTGDISYNNGTTQVRLAVGSSGDVCTVSGGIPSWAAPAEALESVTSKSTTYTALTSDDIILCDASGGAFTVTLYTASGNTGRKLKIKKTDTSVNAVTIDGSGSETMDGNLTRLLHSQYEIIEIQSDGTNWQILDRVIPQSWATFTPVSSQGFGTLTGINLEYRRLGETMEVQGYFTAGTVSANEAQLGLITGHTITALSAATHLAGHYARTSTSPASDDFSVLATSGDTYVNFGIGLSSTTSPLTAKNGDAMSGSSARISVKFSVKISGWESF